MHDSRTIANRFLSLGREEGRSLTPMQLLKLVYIAHGWMLGLYGRPLIQDEVQAWQYGPVIPTLYNALKHYRGSAVNAPIPDHRPMELTPQQDSIVRQVFDIYGGYTGPSLSNITHRPGTPWSKIYRPGSFGLAIPQQIIQNHYRDLAASR